MLSKKIILSITLALGIILSGSTSSIIYAQPNQGYSTNKIISQNINFSKIINYGDSGDSVKKVQNILNLYFNAGLNEDGIYGISTKNAVKNVQNALDISPDGIYGPKTAEAVTGYIESLNESNNENSIIIAKVQKKLSILGYKVTVNGNINDDTTCKALRTIQEKYLLPVTGKINTATLNKIDELIRGACDETAKFESDTNYYISVNSGGHLCKVYEKKNGTWKESRIFDILSNDVESGNYKLGIKGKKLDLTGVTMNNFSQIDGLNVFYSAKKDANCGIRVTDENAEFISSLPKNTTVKIF